jgi:hypothetical protein
MIYYKRKSRVTTVSFGGLCFLLIVAMSCTNRRSDDQPFSVLVQDRGDSAFAVAISPGTKISVSALFKYRTDTWLSLQDTLDRILWSATEFKNSRASKSFYNSRADSKPREILLVPYIQTDNGTRRNFRYHVIDNPMPNLFLIRLRDVDKNYPKYSGMDSTEITILLKEI